MPDDWIEAQVNAEFAKRVHASSHDVIRAVVRSALAAQSQGAQVDDGELTDDDKRLVARGMERWRKGIAGECRLPPAGWHCTRAAGHEGPCAAHRAKPEYGPDNPPRLRRPDESVADYRIAMGWAKPDERAQQAAAPGALDWINDVVRDVCELPDRDSPAGRADMMLVTVNELQDIIERHAPSAPGTPEAPQTAAAHDVLAERQRQMEAEGWTPVHDDHHDNGQMAVAAGYYALASGYPHERDIGLGRRTPSYWPWAPEWWKPRTKRENLVRAGALVLAEIERLDRAAQTKNEVPAAVAE